MWVIIICTRILNCSTNIKNLYTCINEHVVGFTNRIASSGDMVYFAVKQEHENLCVARATLSEPTDFQPWNDGKKYRQCFSIKNIEYCNPFDLKGLSKIGGSKWYLKYCQSSKEIKDKEAIDFLSKNFSINQTDKIHKFDINDDVNTSNENDENTSSDKIKITATFQTISFKNEQDKHRGLEKLVNNHFYDLFLFFSKRNSILIDENRLFKTSSNKGIIGIQGIPDALLITFNKDLKNPFQLNIIEYECYGEGKVKSLDKFNYLNGHIIPQLMRFASTFSIVTDSSIREQTIDNWANKIVDFVLSDEESSDKYVTWMKEINPNINIQKMALEFKNQLVHAFKTNIRIMLIIDELSAEQRDTISNIINSFKLENSNPIAFKAYVVRLEQTVSILNNKYEYALSYEE